MSGKATSEKQENKLMSRSEAAALTNRVRRDMTQIATKITYQANMGKFLVEFETLTEEQIDVLTRNGYTVNALRGRMEVRWDDNTFSKKVE